ncbi:MAG: hypothetical protein EZS28_019114 [Streblomastix strix]|uniref:Uncharacterized protein n=1 Tax=Streblomastix strix TaxID=222440 RepID=A0A5J4VRQ6_9EUKA|nr:MAG: hypothetical protein EZS28_019114 [Streblomastix strix]
MEKISFIVKSNQAGLNEQKNGDAAVELDIVEDQVEAGVSGGDTDYLIDVLSDRIGDGVLVVAECVSSVVIDDANDAIDECLGGDVNNQNELPESELGELIQTGWCYYIGAQLIEFETSESQDAGEFALGVGTGVRSDPSPYDPCVLLASILTDSKLSEGGFVWLPLI